MLGIRLVTLPSRPLVLVICRLTPPDFVGRGFYRRQIRMDLFVLPHLCAAYFRFFSPLLSAGIFRGGTNSALLSGVALHTGVFGRAREDGGTGWFPTAAAARTKCCRGRTPYGVGPVHTPGLSRAPECYAAMRRLGSLRTSGLKRPQTCGVWKGRRRLGRRSPEIHRHGDPGHTRGWEGKAGHPSPYLRRRPGGLGREGQGLGPTLFSLF